MADVDRIRSAIGGMQPPGDDPIKVLEAELWSEPEVVSAPKSEPSDTVLPDAFDKIAYLKAFPDIAGAIGTGLFESAEDHYVRHGCREGRLADARYRAALARANDFPMAGIDAAFATPSGLCLVIGWIDDAAKPLSHVAMVAYQTALGTATQFVRCRRADAEGLVPGSAGRLLGFWTILKITPGSAGDVQSLVIGAGTTKKDFQLQPQVVADEQLAAIAFEYLANSQYFDNPQFEVPVQLERGLGRKLITVNVTQAKSIVARAYVQRFGSPRARFDASMVVCLYGKVEFLFLQSAMFSQDRDAGSVEWIYVSNSPELAEPLLREAEMAVRIYGCSITVVILPGNAGFGAANNVAVNAARSDRIVIINPDVFPRDANWTALHRQVIENLPALQTRLFGVPLYYDDGSMMHAGMYFEMDEGLIMGSKSIRRQEAVRVEHYGKGAPPGHGAYIAARPVPAVTGAFVSADRRWFEELGGFSSEYVYGHYEDADICLKSYVRGTPVWLHNIPFWHLEGKGSTRRKVHEGGSMVNRWHFTRTWGELIRSELLGKAPAAFDAPMDPAADKQRQPTRPPARRIKASA